MSDEKNDRADSPQEVFMNQTTYDPQTKTYTTRCPICDGEQSEKRHWYRSRDGTIDKLRTNYNYCETCGRWVCEDCFLCQDDFGGIGICTECAAERGVKGYTVKEFNEHYPEIKRRDKERIEQLRQQFEASRHDR
jgi:hypothetical protein